MDILNTALGNYIYNSTETIKPTTLIYPKINKIIRRSMKSLTYLLYFVLNLYLYIINLVTYLLKRFVILYLQFLQANFRQQ